MTAMLVFAALIAMNVAYSIYDNRRLEDAEIMDDYYRVEYKKAYHVANAQKSAF